MKCHCGGKLQAHAGGLKDGTYHCNACGCCMTADGEPRPGHAGCGERGIRRPREAAKAEEHETESRARREPREAGPAPAEPTT